MWDGSRATLRPLPRPREAVIAGHRLDCAIPVLLIDLGDNIGGGSAGDGTVLLAELLRQQATGFVVVLHAPAAVAAAKPGRRRRRRARGDRRRGGGPIARRPGCSPRDGADRCTTGSGSRPKRGTAAGGERPGATPRSSTWATGTLLVLNSLRTPAVQPGSTDEPGHRPEAAAGHRGEGRGRVQGGLRADRGRDHPGGHARPDRDQPVEIRLQQDPSADISTRRGL